MKNVTLISSLFFVAFISACSSSSSSSAAAGPVIDSLDVPDTTTPMTIGGQTGPGVVLTLSAHDDSAGIATLHVVFAEGNMDEPVTIPGGPTMLSGQKIQLVVLNAPSGAHQVAFHLTDTKNQNSAAITKTLNVP
ncbi:MAG: hypothetical protein ABIP39_16010 [Polyangiaceae bacterium]